MLLFAKRHLALFFFLYLTGMVTAQSGLIVSGFRALPNDMTSRTLYPERDANGELTALIKVVTTATGFSFDGGSLGIVKVVPKPAEYWVYVPSGARIMTIAHPNIGILRNYDYPLPILAGNVYEMVLSHSNSDIEISQMHDTIIEPTLKKAFPFEPDVVFVKGGLFEMGCPLGGDCDFDELPRRSVSLSDFFIGRYEVTQAEWRAIMGTNPSHVEGCDDCPVERVSYREVLEYIKRLNEQTGKLYRLPTEAEWEYAAKGGHRFVEGPDDEQIGLGQVAWYDENSNGCTHTVGNKQPNALGVYDMLGNVWEWCNDRYGKYTPVTIENPMGPKHGMLYVLKGGSWESAAWSCRHSARSGVLPIVRSHACGFRLAHSIINNP